MDRNDIRRITITKSKRYDKRVELPPCESVESFLARGGTINQVEAGVTGLEQNSMRVKSDHEKQLIRNRRIARQNTGSRRIMIE